MTMRKAAPASVGGPNWRELYTRALLERDRHKLPSRIAEAEKSLILGWRELIPIWDNAEMDEEAHSIYDAVYYLQALKTCSELRTTKPKAA